ncbi:sugar phosphate isomerase/epimerase and 4-hydroxyphenylpyruvate domain-containing protein [Rhodococcus sp. IEGM 1305]|uniref:bifunctional sugar phosphate isomerase/epimerase/4-hydroxyphenylpyruvate dioxygenase family protein n=1 Tax=Rhodococcus sp. IEGM 1305 TaxID=3047092 RepID=UPI0024B84731|nr:sugar phosphate isomerase/epimerase and 4-hydroxyphenylpyruvate domain-containing protein [Rhodococcus sp. IEGM 1305]MDI9953550.1 TIM barrel protein [Rhodococcus sp. IEGM 1305]
MGRQVRTSVATVSLSGSLEEKVTAIAAAGFDGFEVFEPDFVSSPWSPRELASRAADLGLTLDLYQPFRDLDSVDDTTFARNLIRAERKFDIMEQLGCDTLLVCSSPLPEAVRDDARLTEQLHTLAERAHSRGLRIAYEALAWGTHVNTYRHAWKIVQDADHPALGTCLDSFHILSRGDDPSGIRDIPGEKIFFLQLADAPRMSMDILQWSRHHRNFPGQGNFDLATFGAHVQAAGYTGPWSLEIFNDTFRQSSTGRTAADAHRSLLYLQEEVARVQAEQGEDTGRGLALFEPPPRAPLEGIVSLRLAAGPGKDSDLRQALQHIGFRLVGRHRSHDLQLWRHGRMTIVVDATAGTVWTAPGLPAHLPVLTQIGIRSSDPDAWGERAAALEVPVHEVLLPGVDTAPESDVVRLKITDATSLDLRGPGSAASWQSAFDLYPTESRWQDEVPVFTGVDHVALAVPSDNWDGIMLLLRSVFAMAPHEGLDVTDAVGMMRSQALTMDQTGADGMDRPLRISLNMVPGAVSGNSHIAAARRGGISHVAFSCTDIFTAAATMQSNGFEPLVISPNYYDDLEARFGLSRELLDRMSGSGIMYDADAHGEFFHLFTQTVGADLFFEVVQRVGGYEGYGDANSAMRLAAQLRAAG